MADFDLTQTDAQVQSILNDAQDAQGAGAQTTLTTDYIMLKDTSGNYHKILKDSFTEACRNVLAGLLVNNDKGTTISQIPAIASGDFGSVTPANLASVLGASKGEAGSNWDTIIDAGSYAVNDGASATGFPTGAYAWGMLVVKRATNLGTNKEITQIYFTNGASSNQGIYTRTMFNTTGLWRSWQRIDNYGTTSLSDLASALGAFISTSENDWSGTATKDLNSLQETALYSRTSNNTTVVNAPSDITSQSFHLVVFKANYYILQIIFTDANIYWRRNFGGWKSWKKLSGTSV